MEEVKIPHFGESVSEVKIVRFIAKNGAYVSADEELLEVETDKLNQVLYASTAGAVTYRVAEGDVVSIGTVVASIDTSNVIPKEETASVVAPSLQKQEKSIRQSSDEWLQIPDLPPVVQTVTTYTSASSEERKPMSSIRKTIAQRLLAAKQSTAMLTTFNEVDMTTIMHMRHTYAESFVKKYEVKLGLMSFFVKASIAALKEVPIVNAYIDGDDLVYRKSIDISIAVSTDRGLIVPVIKGCSELEFHEIEKRIANFAERAKSGSLALQELAGGGFTITNGGVFGSLLSTPIINPPQCAILGMHKIQKRAVVIDDQIVIRPMMYLALSYDHRVLDGKEAVSFLVFIKECLECPERMLIKV